MIIIDKKTVANIPLLEVVKQEFIQEKCATVFFLHGFSSIKENNLHYAYLLAEKIFASFYLTRCFMVIEVSHFRLKN